MTKTSVAGRKKLSPGSVLNIETSLARHFMLHATGLVMPFADVGAALAQLGFVQIDPINVCGRMHDLILRHRVRDYAEHDLLGHLYPVVTGLPRQAFEHYLPGQDILVAFPLEAWPFLVPHMRQRASNARGFNGRLSREERALARRILAEIGQRGPLLPDAIDHDARMLSGWGTQGRAAKVVLEKLLVHGEVLIVERQNFRRVYDLPARVLPRAVFEALPAHIDESRRWRLLQCLKQRRLVRMTRADLVLVEDLVQRIAVPDCPPLYCLQSDLSLFQSIAREEPRAGVEPRLLAPLDPLIYDRRITSALWGYDYTWEVYTPPARRVRGYYALPLLSGLELVGHVDPKADRGQRCLRVVSRSVRRGHRSAGAVKSLAEFLGLQP